MHCELGQYFADDTGKFEAMPRETGRDNHALAPWMYAEQEMLIGRIGIDTGLGTHQLTIQFRYQLDNRAPHLFDLSITDLSVHSNRIINLWAHLVIGNLSAAGDAGQRG